MTALRRPRPFSDPPDVRLLGIDEAGRGCVLGSLVVGAYLTEHPEETLRAAGAGDSKRMSMTRREQARSRLESLGEMHVREITAAQIDAGNLNTLEEEAIVSILQQTRPDEVRIDALGALFVGIKVQVEPDEFPVVNAALRLSGISVDRLEDL